MTKKHLNQMAIYQLDNGSIQFRTDGEGSTLWASLSEIAELFNTDKSGISRHINKIYQWATKTLKEHIEKGYTLNRQRIKANYDEFLNAVEKVKGLLPGGDAISHDSVLELIKLFADT